MSAVEHSPGDAVERFEDERFLRGEASFVGDLELPNLCHAVVVRSPLASGRILAIDPSAALALPGVVKVITHADIAGLQAAIPIRVGNVAGLERYLQFPVAHDRVRYVGEPVAVVIATDPYVAEDGADLVAVDLDADDAVVGIADALDDRVRARVPHREALAGQPAEERRPGGRAVEDGVADDHVLVRREAGTLWRPHGEDASREPLADVVVRVAVEHELDARGG